MSGVFLGIFGADPQQKLVHGANTWTCNKPIGGMIYFDEHIFQMGWNHHLLEHWFNLYFVGYHLTLRS